MTEVKIPRLDIVVTSYRTEYQPYRGDDDRLEVVDIEGTSKWGDFDDVIADNYEYVRMRVLESRPR